MIEKLNEEQEKLLDVFRDKWIKIGLSTEKCDRVLAEKHCKDAYVISGLPAPHKIVWTVSPIEAIIFVSLLDISLDDSSIEKKLDNLSNNYWVDEWELIKDKALDIYKSINLEVRKSIEKKYISAQVYGQHDAGWLSQYDYFLNCLGIKECNQLVPLMELAKNCGWWIPLGGIAILQEKPIKCIMVNELLHCPDGPAIEYVDGFKIYSLNGVNMNGHEWLFNKEKTISEKCNLVMKIASVDQRLQAQKLLGLHNFLDHFKAKKIGDSLSIQIGSKSTSYQLLDLTINNRSGCKFLQMTNPSTGETHIEGVHPDVKNVKDAMDFRGIDLKSLLFMC